MIPDPFSLLQAIHPTRTASGDILWPFIYNTFGHDRAANGYPSTYLVLFAGY